MLSLLPAFILLILGSPSDSERMAIADALRAAPVENRIAQSRQAEQALASLLALGGGPEASRAIAELICFADYLVEAQSQPVAPVLAEASPEPCEPLEAPPGQTQDGFLENRRSRDGPFFG